MDFFINIIESRINKELIFSVASEFRMGGLNRENYAEFIDRVKKIPEILENYYSESKDEDIDDFFAFIQPDAHYREKIFLIKHILSDFNLTDVSELEANRIWKKVECILYNKTKSCWHPEASKVACTLDTTGDIKISSAHSIQEGKILKSISENNKVKQLKFYPFEYNPSFPIKFASTFYGFCDKHDKIFNPIEKLDYLGTDEQNFLFAYRAFVHTSHVKLVLSEYYDFGNQPQNDIKSDRITFNDIIIAKDYKRIKTEIVVLDFEYPIAVSSSSDLDFDYIGNSILHSENRLERFYITVFPNNGKTYILFSYFDVDITLYGDIINQIKKRNKIESDLSVLISGHCENTYFKPSYYDKNIVVQEDNIYKLICQTQFDFVPIDSYGNKTNPISKTPKNYLENEFNVQLFIK